MKPRSKPIIPCLWFDNQAEEAVQFYKEVFSNVTVTAKFQPSDRSQERHKLSEGKALSVDFTMHGQKFLALNGGPMYTHSPGISFFVTCETLQEANHVWNSIEKEGRVLMPWDTYPWSEKYGWINDKYGVSWQISLGSLADVGQKFAPSIMLIGDKFGKAEEAIHFYMDVFKDAKLEGIARYEEGDGDVLGKVKHAQFYLNGYTFMIMESSHDHQFDITPAISLMVYCDNQSEIDYYWERLTQGGGDEVQCGWLYDKFGVSWQIVPKLLTENMSDPAKAPKLMAAFMPMKKMDIAVLEAAIN
ncbi:VOC family protein [Lunatibacter salilacus]|uniref:VOC family protein n=1 Tax=Lunatibacter salilacus TaxID=2483804 RepID=UPI00131B332C|nr:VOC family protein [Lunatibacter salilacus]